ncbi:MAG: hypothetical protein ACRC57_10565 [Sarcina sp.]
MWSEKRKIENGIFLAGVPIAMVMAFNFIYFFRGMTNEDLQSLGSINSFAIFIAVASFLLTFSIKQVKISEEKKQEVNMEMLKFKLLSVVFILYIIFALFVMRDKDIVISGLIMCAGYINLYILNLKNKSLSKVNDVQKNWRIAYNRDSNEESNLLWRIKPILTPHVSVDFGERLKNVNWFMVFCIFLIAGRISFDMGDIPILVFLAFIFGKEIIYSLDIILGLYAKTEGVCTGVVERSERSRTYYDVYVTDFSNKREIKFKIYDECFFKEQDNIRLIHGSISKKVIKSSRMA